MNLLSMIFPGQGSHYIGMMSDFNVKNLIIKNTFNEASNILGYDLLKLIQYGEKKELNQTWKTQPALLSCSIAIYRLWLNQGGEKPKLIAGHSLGEYTALVCSQVINFTEAIKLVEYRGKLMHKYFPNNIGSMKVIIGLNHNLIIQACKECSYKKIVEPVNFNSPEQVVISGHKEAVEKAGNICKKMGAKLVLELPINIPSHSSLMKDISIKLKIKLEKMKFKKPKIPFVNNVDVKIENNPKFIKNALVRQIYSPVLWMDIINFMSNKVKYFLEIGPNKILTNLSNKINKNIISIAINSEKNLLHTINKIKKKDKNDF